MAAVFAGRGVAGKTNEGNLCGAAFASRCTKNKKCRFYTAAL